MRILVMIPIKPSLHTLLRLKCYALAGRLAEFNPQHELSLYFDSRPEPAQPGDSTPWSKVTRIRNKALEAVNWQAFDYICWIDADVVEYDYGIISALVQLADGGVAAPMVLIEKWGQRFYDYCAFVIAGQSHVQPTNRKQVRGRNLAFDPPYWYPTLPREDVVPMDCVGTFYVVHTDIYRSGVRHEDHPAFTDHFPICAKAREMGRRVVVDRRLVVKHANLPMYGEAWH
jgi:hypothetical protein